jgi:two-component system LytT family sensor kinase
MLKMKKRDWIEFLIHLAGWTAVSYVITALGASYFTFRMQHSGMYADLKAKENLPLSCYLILIFLLMTLFYGNIFWIFKKAIAYKKMISRLALGVSWFLLLVITNYILLGILYKPHDPFKSPLPPFFNVPVNPPNHPLPDMNASYAGMDSMSHLQINMLLVFVSIGGLSIAYFLLKEWTRNELIRSRLAASHYSTEIKFLKSQINPHFLFNTLNNLFSMAQKKGNDELADGISKLSGMMRYMIYESNADTVPLAKEIEYLQNCIQLNKLRFADAEAKVNFQYPERIEGIVIVPMLFIPFVENAFKHGVQIDKQSIIDISIKLVNKEIIFNCQNPVRHRRKMDEDTGGIGLENVRRRLELVYPHQHQLTIKNDEEVYLVELKISPA